MFKKASADFDEGGARGLLLNNLAIDHHGRLSFDSNDDPDKPEGVADTAELPAKSDTDPPNEPPYPRRTDADAAMDTLLNEITRLRNQYFPDLDRVDTQVLCPSIRDFDMGNPTSVPGSLYLNSANHEHTNEAHESDEHDGMTSDMSLEMPPGNPLIDSHDHIDSAFGGGGEDWAVEATSGSPLDFSGRREAIWEASDRLGNSATEPKTSSIALGYGPIPSEYNGMLGFLDNILEKNWAGPEHWRIQKLKDHNTVKPTVLVRRKERNAFEVNFLSAMCPSDAEAIHTRASSSSAICLPRTQLKSSSRNLLPDDKHFNSRDLLGLFLKPRARIGHGGLGKQSNPAKPYSANAAFNSDWSGGSGPLDFVQRVLPGEESAKADYDADFFQDDGLDLAQGLPTDEEDEFENAREQFSPEATEVDGTTPSENFTAKGYQGGPFGSHLVVQGRRAKPEYLQFAKSAKKIDVRQLKEELWKGIRPVKVRNCRLALVVLIITLL